MYKIELKFNTNSIKGDDIIKTMKTMLAFGIGVTSGLLFEKYNKDIMKIFKKTNSKVMMNGK